MKHSLQTSRFGNPITKALIAWAALLVLPLAHSQSFYEEQGQLVRGSRNVTALGADLFGDNVNTYTGALEFTQTDVSLPGNNALAVRVGRKLSTGSSRIAGGQFGDWDLDIPHLKGVFATADGWAVDQAGANRNKRCTYFGAPPDSPVTVNSPAPVMAEEFWQGNYMVIPGAGEQELLQRSSANTSQPTDGNTYPIVTAAGWQVRCLPTLANGQSGEGFVAVSPEGTQYRFDWLVSRTYPSYRYTLSGGGPLAKSATAPTSGGQTQTSKTTTTSVVTSVVGSSGLLNRVEVLILPTQVTDRFGNTVNYTYDPANPWRLSSITSGPSESPARTLSLGYLGSTNLISTVNDGTRTWNYTYNTVGATSTLASVTQPDTRSWSFSGANLQANPSYTTTPTLCDSPGTFTAQPLTTTMVHPSGATGSFTLTQTLHGRSFVAPSCPTAAGSTTNWYPVYFVVRSLSSKTITGPGLPTLNWLFDYGSANGGVSPCAGCTGTKTVKVTDPTGSVTRYEYGNRWRETEGLLQRRDEGWSASATLGSTTLSYASPTAGPYPDPIGYSPQDRGDSYMYTRHHPTAQRSIAQQGSTFTWTASAFDFRARPFSASRSGPGSVGRTETTAYDDNTNKWVLGQIKTVTDSSGKVMVSNAYDASTATLTSTARFGKLAQSYTYWPDGTLKTRKDGLNQTTTLSNYKRGLAQNVSYADGTTESAVVNNIGNVSSVTDPNNYTTNYGYDAIGRLNQISPPTGDPAGVWNITTLSFVPVPSNEYGLAPGHWLQTVATGNARTLHYFDALWRPVLTRTFDTADEGNTRSVVLRKFDGLGQNTFTSYAQRANLLVTDTVAGVAKQYDALGRITVQVEDSGLGALTTYNYYEASFKTRQVNPRNKTTTTTYAALDQPEQAYISNIALPEGVNVAINRDTFGKPLSIVRGPSPSNVRYYVYDGNELLCKTIEPETNATIQALDAANNVTWRAAGVNLTAASCDTASVPDANKVKFTYDARNRLKTTTYGSTTPLATPVITRTYTPDGLPATISSAATPANPASTWTYTYNRLRSLNTQSLAYNAQTFSLAQTYDANGSLSQLTYPDSAQISFAPNALGQPRQALKAGSTLHYATNVLHHPNGAVKSYTLGNGKVHTLTQNSRGLPEQNADTGVLQDFYSYDQNANITSITDQLASKNRSMAYDGLDRLITANAPAIWGTGTYAYNVLDDLTVSTVGARNSSHSYDAQKRLESINTNGTYTYYTYDNRGNITSKGAQGYVFDQANRLVTASGVASYAYDGLGRRVYASGINPQPSRTTVYGQGGQLFFSNSQQNALTTSTRYVYLGGKLIAEDGTAGVVYNHTDALGSPVARSNASGQLLSTTSYEPYGKTAAGTNPAMVGFTGHVNDGDTGLVQMQQRYYDPLAARFMSEDPVMTNADTGKSFNRYVYGNNNPYRYVDPDGRDPKMGECGWVSSMCQQYGASDSARKNPGYDSRYQFQQTAQMMGSVAEDLLRIYTDLMLWFVGGDLFAGGKAAMTVGMGVAAKGIANPVPSTMARVISNGTPATTLGRPGAADVFVTGASDIAGLNGKQIAQRLTIPESPTGFKVIEFATPTSGVASPVFRGNPGFVGGGRTAGGAREFVIPNGPVPADSIIRTVP